LRGVVIDTTELDAPPGFGPAPPLLHQDFTDLVSWRRLMTE
jgi:hypothetical protein